VSRGNRSRFCLGLRIAAVFWVGSCPLTGGGVTKRLYAAIRTVDGDKPYMAHLLRLAREIPVRMQRREPVEG